MTFPFTRKSLVVKAFNCAQPRRSGNHRNVLPLLVPLKNLLRYRIELLLYPPMFRNAPHGILCLYLIWYVKSRSLIGITLRIKRRASAKLLRGRVSGTNGFHALVRHWIAAKRPIVWSVRQYIRADCCLDSLNRILPLQST